MRKWLLAWLLPLISRINLEALNFIVPLLPPLPLSLPSLHLRPTLNEVPTQRVVVQKVDIATELVSIMQGPMHVSKSMQTFFMNGRPSLAISPSDAAVALS